MPIAPIILQRRLAEVGRIRIGQSVPITKKNGQPGTRPAKLDRFRFTSADKVRIEQIAQAYGGEVREWTPANGGAPQWEVVTETDTIPIVVPPQPVTQWMELWSGGGCTRRCDGDREMRGDRPCVCAAEDDMQCKPTTRLSVLLRDIEGLGSYRLESHGWNAAAELPGMAELLSRSGGYVGARLYLKRVRQVSDGQTKDFLVPAIAVDGLTPAQLLAGGDAPAAIAAPAPVAAQITDGSSLDYIAQAQQANTLEELRALWSHAKNHGHTLTDDETAALLARVADVKAGLAAQSQPVGDDDPADEPAPPSTDTATAPAAVSVDPDAVWDQIVRRAGNLGWSLTKVESEFAKANAGTTPQTASAGELAAFLADMDSQDVA